MTQGEAGGPRDHPVGVDDSTRRRWNFGPAIFDELSFELRVDGQPVRMERKPLDVLAYLLRRAGEVVTKDEIAKQLWPRRILTESVLSRCISVLRAALKDRDRSLIMTVHGHGYRLAATIRVEVAKRSSPTAVAEATAVDPTRRLSEAAWVTEHLRSLESRRRQRASEKTANERAERVRRVTQELRRVRAYALVLLALTAATVAAGFTAHRARGEAIAAAVSARSINDFLMDDVLSVNPTTEHPAAASYESLLNRASAQVDRRFAGNTEAAANVHWLLGRRYQDLGLIEAATNQYERAAAQFEKVHGRDADSTMLALDRIALLHADNGRIRDALSIARELRHNWLTRHEALDLSTLLLRVRLATVSISAGDLTGVESELREILGDIPRAIRPTEHTEGHLREWLGYDPAAEISPLATERSARQLLSAHVNSVLGSYLVEYADDYRAGANRLHESARLYSEVLGQDSEPLVLATLNLGRAKAMAGDYGDSEELIEQAVRSVDATYPAWHHYRGMAKYALASLRLEQRRHAEAAALVREAADECVQRCPARMHAEHSWLLGKALDGLGHRRDAIDILRASVRTYEQARGDGHVGSIRRRVSLAEALRNNGNHDEASAVLSQISPQALKGIPSGHLVIGNLRRERALVALEKADFKYALAELEHSLLILSHRLGPSHWRTQRVRDELAHARASAARAGAGKL